MFFLTRLIGFLIFFQICDLRAQEVQIVVPQQYEKNIKGKDISVKEKFYSYPFLSENVDLKDFQQKYPSLALPDSFKIKLPNLEGILDTMLLLGFVKDHTTDPGLFVLLVVGNYNSPEVSFFIDANVDQNYLNDGAPTIVQAGAAPIYVQLHPAGKKPRELGLSVPERPNLIKLKLQELKQDYKARMDNKLSLGFALGAGTGKLIYQYHNIDLGFPTWYNVSLVEKDLRLSLSYNFHRFGVGVNANYSNLYYYTSYLNIRFDNPRGLRTGVLTERNIDRHARNRLQFGVSAAFRIFLSQFIELQPIFTYGRSSNFPKDYFLDTRPNKEVVYKLSPNPFLEYGIQMEFTTGAQRAFFLNIIRNQLRWRPDNFLEDLNFSNLKIKHLSWKFTLGYRFGL